ncbi:biopolymer transporter ExbD [Paludisphaera rhizosphaerae]|nr:biopolymer transporter ExbD [Paludisphaera rhizosphaerae]
MPSWDVFYSDRLELARGLTAEEIRAGLAAGSIREDDLVRPSGTSVAWARVADVPELAAPPAAAPPPPAAPTKDVYEVEPEPEPEPEPPVEPARRVPPVEDRPEPVESGDLSFPVVRDDAPPPADWEWDDEEELAEDLEEGYEEDEDEEDIAYEPVPRQATASIIPEPVPVSEADLGPDDLHPDRLTSTGSSSSRVALPTARSRDYDERQGDEDEEDEGLVSLRRAGPQKVEELDLAAMVDVAFQLVLFFLVTATTVLYKTLEIPKPSAEAPPEAVAQARNRTLDDLKNDYILVEIDAEGNVKIDQEPVPAQVEALVQRLREARDKTDRKAMLLSADFTTRHRSAVLAYDAANEIGLSIAIAKPAPPAGPPPALRPADAPKKAGA